MTSSWKRSRLKREGLEEEEKCWSKKRITGKVKDRTEGGK